MSDSLDWLGDRVRERLGPPPRRHTWPTVSIVVTSHNGEAHLRTLLHGLAEHTDYPELELIVVDNGSSDKTLETLRTISAPFPVSIVANAHNETFSDANNQGAELARGELLLLLNNDVEPFEDGWLRELVECLMRTGAGAAGATLVYPDDGDDGYEHGFRVQHRGLRFRDESGVLRPALHGWGADPLDGDLGHDIDSAIVVAACVIVETALYRSVGGLTRGYRYGSEDIDFCLKIRAAGHRVVCSGRSVLMHRPGSTRRTLAFEDAAERKERNHRLLLETWGPRLRREHDLDALRGGGPYVQEGREAGARAASVELARATGLCVKASGELSSTQSRAVARLEAATRLRGHRWLSVEHSDGVDLATLDYDVAVHVGAGRHSPRSSQLNVLWDISDGNPLGAAERGRYDAVVKSEDANSVLEAVAEALERRRFPTRIDRGRPRSGAC